MPGRGAIQLVPDLEGHGPARHVASYVAHGPLERVRARRQPGRVHHQRPGRAADVEVPRPPGPPVAVDHRPAVGQAEPVAERRLEGDGGVLAQRGAVVGQVAKGRVRRVDLLGAALREDA